MNRSPHALAGNVAARNTQVGMWSRTRHKIVREFTRAQRWWRLKGLARVGSNVAVSGPVVFLGRDRICLGSRVSIAGFLHIWGHGGVTIGDDVLIASHVAISSVTHDPHSVPFSRHNIGKEVRIGNNVWIGSHSFIGAGVTVGDGSIVAAGAIVLEDVEPRTIVGGVPARKLRDLPEVRYS